MANPADFLTPDFFKTGFDADFMKTDFLKNYQGLSQQSWEAWLRQLQSPTAATTPPFTAPPSAAATGNDALERTLAGLKGYFEWMQGMTAGTAGIPGADWQQQLQQLFDGGQQPFAQAFHGIDGAGAEGFGRQWQSWLQGMQQGGSPESGPTPTFGLNREQQMQRQALTAAMLESFQASARYQSLIQRANTQGMQRLQDKLAEHAEPGRQIESLKALYDLWVDAAEEAYAEIALTDEFRDVYGEMVNSQMRVRQLQQQQTEQLCQQWGVPTRSEIASLGERLQQVRREVRAFHAHKPTEPSEEIAALRRELAALRQTLGTRKPAVSVKKAPAKAAAKKSDLAVKKAVKKAPVKKAAGPSRKSTAAKSKPPARPPATRKATGNRVVAGRKTAKPSAVAPRKRK